MFKFEKDTIGRYIKSLQEKSVTPNEIKRKLQSIKKFLDWTVTTGHLDQNDFKQMSQEIANAVAGDSPVIPTKACLAGRQVAIHNRNYIDPVSEHGMTIDNTIGIRNYIAFAVVLLLISLIGFGLYNQFFKKTATPFAYPAALTPGSRIISFQGRLTDSIGNPIIAPIDLTYKFYTVSTGGSPITGSTRVCTVSPDQDGVFANLIGSDPGPSCTPELPATIFSENPQVWLGVTVGSELTEMSPRQQIANVGYAMNAETLQGFPPGTTVSTIPFISTQGDLLIAAATPGIRSTYTTANFVISSAKTTTIQSANAGDIVLSATDGGALRFNTYNGSLVERLTVLSGGNVGISNVNPRAAFDVIGSASISANLAFSGASTQIGQLNGGNISFATSPGGDTGLVTKMTLTNLGNVGIGSTLPAYLFDVSGGSGIVGQFSGRVIGGNAVNNNEFATLGQIAAGGGQYWQRTNGALSPTTLADDVLLGATSTSSAKFAFMNVYSGTPTASISGNLAIASPTGTNPATSYDIFNGGSFNLRTSPGGDAGLASRLFVNNAGNVGIGSAVPVAKFEIKGGTGDGEVELVRLTDLGGSTFNRADIKFNTRDGIVGTIGGGNVASGTIGLALFGGDSTGANDTPHLFIKSTGNVGISNTSPLEKLDVTGSASISANLTIGQTGVLRSQYGPLNLAYKSSLGGWTTGLTLQDTTGNVGIGTTNPSSILHSVKTSSGAYSTPLLLTNSATANSTGTGIDFNTSTDPAVINARILSERLGGNADGNIEFWSRNDAGSFAEKMRIDSEGNVGIGSTSPTSFKLEVAGNIGPDANATRDIGSSARHYNTIYADNVVGIGALGYWQRGTGVLFPNTLTDGLAATTSATTVATFTSTGSNNALLAGGASNNLTVGPTGSLTFNAVTNDIVTGTDEHLALMPNGTGNVGIGSSSPGYKLDVSGSILGLTDIRVGNGTNIFEPVSTWNAQISSYGDVYAMVDADNSDTSSVFAIRANGTASNVAYIDQTGSASLSANLTIGQTGVLRSQYGPLNLAYKSGLNAWTTGLTLQDTTGNVGIGSTNPGAFKLEVAGNIGPEADNTRDLGSSSKYYANIYANNIVGSGALGYWKRGVGTLYPNVTSDAIAATSSGTTVATFTSTGTNNALRAGGNTNYATLSSNGNLAFTNSGVATITGPTTGLTIDATTGALNFGTSANARTITIGNVTTTTGVNVNTGTAGTTYTTTNGIFTLNTGTGTISLGTDAVAKTITIGNATTTTGLALNSGTGDIVLTSTDQVKLNSSKAAGGTTTEALSLKSTVDLGVADELLQIGDSGADFLTILGNGNVGIGTALPSSLAHLYSTSTSTSFTGFNLDWSPGSGTTTTGDLFALNIGTNGSASTLFNVKDTGSSLFSVSETAVTSNLPTSFTSAGDVSIAYDLLFTNPTSSYIKSSAPLYIQAGEVFGSSDLTLKTYNSGDVVLDAAGGVTLSQAQPWSLATSTTALNIQSGLLNLDTTNTRVGIGTTAPTEILDVVGNASASGNITLGQTGALRSQYGPLNLAYKSGLNAWTNGLTLQDTTGNVGIGSANPGAFKLEVAGNIGPDGNNTRNIGSSSRYYNTIYVNNIVGSGGLGYWSRGTGVLFPATTTDGVAATTSATTTATFTATGSNNALRVGGNTNYAGIDVNGNLTFTNSGIATITGPTTGLTIDATTGAMNFGTSANARTITIGNATTTTGLALNSGTGDIILTSTDQVKLNSSKAAGGTTTEALSLKSTIDLGVADELLQIGDSGADFLTILGNGNVGIGTTTVTAKLDVAGDASTSGHLVFRGATPNYLHVLNGTDLRISTSPGGDAGNVDRLTLLANGNVGVGTTSPDSYLDVTGSAVAGSKTLRLRGGDAMSAPADSYQMLLSYYGGVSYTHDIRTRHNSGATTGNAIDFYTWNYGVDAAGDIGTKHIMTLEGTGNVGIGSTSPSAFNLEVAGNIGPDANATRDIGSSARHYNTIYADNVVGIGALGYWSRGTGVLFPATITDGVAATTSATTVATFTATGSNNALQTGGASNYLTVGSTGSLTFNAVTNDIVTGTNEHLALMPNGTGNVGVGTTTPLQKLHVEGQCVAMGTLIRRRRRRKNGDDEEDVPVEDILPGDEVMSLNEKTGEFEWQMVEKTMDKGVQTSYELVTESGKKIETTGNHPYLVNNQKTAQRADLVSLIGSLIGWIDTLKGSLAKEQLFVKYQNKSGVDSPGVEPGRLGVSIQPSEPAEPTQGLLSQKRVKNSTWTKVVYLRVDDEIAVAKSARFDTDKVVKLGWEKIISIKKLARKQMYDLQIARTRNFVANGIVAHNTYISGNVGIGTTGPGYKLDVQSARADFNLQSTTTTNYTLARIYNTNAKLNLGVEGSVAGTLGGGTLAYSAYVGSANPVLHFGDTDTVRMTLSSGNVGIGTTGPGAKLQIVGLYPGSFNGQLDVVGAAGSPNAVITLDSDTNGTGRKWGIWSSLVDWGDFAIRDNTAGTVPFRIINGDSGSNSLVINSGNVGIGSTSPTSFKLEVAGNIGPDADNTRDLGSSSRYYANIYANNIVGSGALGYWKRGVGTLYPNVTSDAIAATSSGTTVATFTATGSNDAARIGGSTNYATINASGNLTFTNAGVATITGPTTGLTIDATTGALNFGTTANARTITIGNITTTTGVNVNTGTAGTTYTTTNGIFTLNTGTGTISLGTDAVAKTITIGNATTTTGLALNSGTGDIVLTSTDQVKLNSSKAAGGTTTEALSLKSTIDLGVADELLQIGDSGADFLTILGNGNVGIGTALPSSLAHLYSTSTSTSFTGFNLDWSPGSSTTTTGDLFALNIGTNGTASTLFNVKDTGSSLFSVSETAVTSNLPTSFTSAGDVSIAYDLLFTNPTSSYIKSSAPLYIQAGEVFGSSDLTLTTYNSGDVVLDAAGGVTLAQAQPWSLATSTTALNIQSGLLNLDTTNTRVGIGTTAPTEILDIVGNASASGNITLGQTGALRSQYGPLNLAYKSALNAWTNGLTLQDTTGNVGIGSANPGAFKLEVAGNIGPEADNTRNLGSASRYFNTIYVNNIVGSGALGYWNRGVGVLYPATLTDGIAATTSATTVATFTATGSNDALRAGGVSNYATIGSTGSLTFNAVTNDIVTGSNEHLALMPNGTGNVGIGSSSPGYKLDVNGRTSITGDADTGTPDILLNGAGGFGYAAGQVRGYKPDNTLGWYWDANNLNTFGIGLQVVNGFSVVQSSFPVTGDSYFNNGSNVGIGTTTVTAKLDIAGDASTSGHLVFRGATPNYIHVLNGTDLRISTSPGGDAGNTDRLTLLANGNVGIGTTGPSAKLAVQTTTAGVPSIPALGASNGYVAGYFTNNDPAYGLLLGSLNSGNSWIQVQRTDTTATAYDMLLQPNGGNVGIGTTGSLQKLHVEGSSILANTTSIDPDSYSGYVIAGDIADGSGWGATGIGGNKGTGDSWALAHNGSALYLGMQNGAAANTMQTYMQFDPNRNMYLVPTSGNVGVGTTGPGQKLDVNGISRFRDYLNFGATDGEGILTWTGDIGGGQPSLIMGGNSGRGLFLRANGSNSTGAYINTSGNVGIGTTGPQTALNVYTTGVGDNRALIRTETTAGSGTNVGLWLLGGASNANWFIGTNRGDITAAADDLFFYKSAGTSGSKLVIKDNGNIGIGTTGPGAKLAVSGGNSFLNDQANSGASARNFGPKVWTDNLFGMELGNNGTLWTTRILTRDSDGGIEFGKYPSGSTTNVNQFSPWMTIINNGNVGIGTTAPTALLDVRGNATFSGTLSIAPMFIAAAGTCDISSTGKIYYDATLNRHYYCNGTTWTAMGGGVAGSGTLNYVTKWTPDGATLGNSVIYDTGTNVGIGTTTVNAKLEIAGTAELLRLNDSGDTYRFEDIGTQELGIAGDNSGIFRQWFLSNNSSTRAYDAMIYIAGDEAGGWANTLQLTHTGASGYGSITTGAGHLVLNSSTGNVGIGSTGPQGTLDVAGVNSYFGTSAGGARINATGSGAGAGAGLWLRYTDNNAYYDSSLDTVFRVNQGVSGITAMTIKGSGNVGIGTTAPLASLHLTNSTGLRLQTPADDTFPAITAATRSTGGEIRAEASSGSDYGTLILSAGGETGLAQKMSLVIKGYGVTDTMQARFLNGNTSLMTVLGGGNVGIGTTAPTRKLEVNGGAALVNGGSLYLAETTGQTQTRLYSYSNANSLWMVQPTTQQFVLSDGIDWDRGATIRYTAGVTGAVTGQLSIGQLDKNSATWTHGITSLYTNGTEQVRINSSGNVGIGTTGPDAKLNLVLSTSERDTVPAMNINDGYYFYRFGYAAPRTSGLDFYGESSNWYINAGNSEPLHLAQGQSAKLSIVSGNVGIGSTAPTAKLDVAGNLNVQGYATASASLSIGGFNAPGGVGNALFSGNVGIGTSSPTSRFFVNLGSNQLARFNDGSSASGATFQNGSILSQSSQFQIAATSTNPLSFYTGATINSMTPGTERMRIATGGNVGIGGALNTNAQLDLNGGTILAGQFCPTSTCQRYVVPNGISRIDQLQVSSDLPNNTGYISFLDANNSYVPIASISAQATGTVVIDNTATNITDVGYPSVPDLCIGDPYWCTGKVDAGTIDPPYTINGKKYATFLTAMTGVKEETTGFVTTSKIPDTRYQIPNTYSYIIDFNSVPEASDLWLFSKTTNLRKNLGKMTVLLTPSDDTRTWYKVDKDTHSLTIYSSRPTTVSYRLTAPRFDGERWTNENPGGSGGFELNDPDQPSLVTLNQVGNVPAETFTILPLADSGSNFQFEIRNLKSMINFPIFKVMSDKTGDFIEEVGVFAQITVGQIKAGFIETENAIVNNMLLAKNIVAEQVTSYKLQVTRLFVDEKIVSPVVETTDLTATGTATLATVQTNEIAPKNDDLTIDLDRPNSPNLTSQVEKGALGRLIIKGLNDKNVASIDSAGNATFAGTLSSLGDLSSLGNLSVAKDASISGGLTASEASLSGTLVAKEVKADNINSLTREFVNSQTDIASHSSTLAQLSTTNEQLYTDINTIQAELAQIKNNPLPNANYYQNIGPNVRVGSSDPNVTGGQTGGKTPPLQDLTVTGNSNLYNASVANSLTAGNIFIQNNEILSLSWELKLSALAQITLFDGSVTITKNGNITTEGEVIAKGGVRTDTIRPTNNDKNVAVELNSKSQITNDKSITNNKLQITNNGNEVASIDASGSARFNALGFNQIATNSALIADSGLRTTNDEVIPAMQTNAEAAGQGILPLGAPEIIIYNDKITKDSLVYLTKTGDTGNEPLTVVKKVVGERPYFSVSAGNSQHGEIKFNWLIIN